MSQSTDPSSATDVSPRKSKYRTFELVLACGLVLAVALVISQTEHIVPLNPLTLTPQTAQPEYVWSDGDYGAPAGTVVGASTTYGTTLLLNTINTNASATATYSLRFPDLRDLQHLTTVYTLYIPGQLTFAAKTDALRVTLGDQNFTYYPTVAVNFSWYAHNPAFIPNNTDLVHIPSFVGGGGNYLFIPFNLTSATLADNASIPISITVPAHGQIYIPEFILSASVQLAPYVPTTSRVVGLVTLPLTIGAVAGAYALLRYFRAWRYAATLTIAFSIRVALAPAFMHSDVSTFIRFSQLYFNYHLPNLQTWSYGLAWYGAIIAPAAPLYAAGVNPSFAEWDLLLKLPAIAADLLTFLVVIAILSPRIGERQAYLVSAIGWLFNPVVVYFSSVHGIDESIVALAIALLVYALTNRKYWAAVCAAVAAVLAILVAVFVVPVIVTSRRVTWPQRLALVFVTAGIYIGVFLGLYRSVGGLLAYLERIGARTNQSSLVLGAASTSPMSYLFLAYKWFGVYISPALGAAAVVGACAVLWLRRKDLLPERSALAIYASVLGFYLTYEVFYVQHLIWGLPALVCLVALAPRVTVLRATIFIAALSTLALVINYVAYYEGKIRMGYASPALSLVLFVWMVVPIVLWLPPRWQARLLGRGPTIFVRLGAVCLSLYFVYDWAELGRSYIGIAAVSGLCASAYATLSYYGESFHKALTTSDQTSIFAFVLAVGLPLYLVYASPVGITAGNGALLLCLASCGLYEILVVTLDYLHGGHRASVAVARGANSVNSLNPPAGETT